MMRTIYAYLLWLPPLGWLGLHQCYLGRHYHAVWIFTTFAGFFLGWFRDVWRIPTYVNIPTRMIEVEHVGCCGVCARVKSAIRNCFGRFVGGQQQGITPKLSKKEDADTAPKVTQLGESAQPVQKAYMQKTNVEDTARPDVLVKKLIEEIVAEQLRNKIDKDGRKLLQEYEIQPALQGPLMSKIEEFAHFSQSNDKIMKLLQNDPLNEEQVKQKLWLTGEFAFQGDLAKIVKEKVNISKEKRIEGADSYVSDDEEENHGKGKSKIEKRKIIGGGSLRIMDNLERVFGAFITARYYRALVAAAVSDYLETAWITYYPLKFLPSVGMMCGVYLVSNIGSPPRLTLSALFLSGLVAEVLFAVVAEALFGRCIQILACLVCTVIAVWKWEWPKVESGGWPSKYSCFIVTLCACIVMILVWGSIVMNTRIEVEGDNITISTAIHNFYNSPAWTQMKEALWDVIIMYLTGNYDEASETLLRMSDLSGAERALAVLGLSRDADEATIKAQYKKLAREWHPDKYQGEDKEAASNKFIEIQQAYTLLTKRIRA